jgi:hypothetical protein
VEKDPQDEDQLEANHVPNLHSSLHRQCKRKKEPWYLAVEKSANILLGESTPIGRSGSKTVNILSVSAAKRANPKNSATHWLGKGTNYLV